MELSVRNEDLLTKLDKQYNDPAWKTYHNKLSSSWCCQYIAR